MCHRVKVHRCIERSAALQSQVITEGNKQHTEFRMTGAVDKITKHFESLSQAFSFSEVSNTFFSKLLHCDDDVIAKGYYLCLKSIPISRKRT